MFTRSLFCFVGLFGCLLSDDGNDANRIWK